MNDTAYTNKNINLKVDPECICEYLTVSLAQNLPLALDLNI